MRVRQKHEVQRARRDGQSLILEEVLALLHAAVNYAALVAGLDVRAASRDLMRRAEKCYFHFIFPFVLYVLCFSSILHRERRVGNGEYDSTIIY